MNWSKKKYGFLAWVFCFIFSESKCQIFCGNFLSSYPTLLAIFSVLPPLSQISSVTCFYVHCLHSLGSFRFIALLRAYHHWELCHYQSIYFKSCSPFWWWCWIFKHPPVWQLCNFLVQTFTTYFLGLFQYFRQTFPFVFFGVTVYWIGWIFSFLVPSILVSHVNDLLRKARWKISLRTTIGKYLSLYYHRSLSCKEHNCLPYSLCCILKSPINQVNVSYHIPPWMKL